MSTLDDIRLKVIALVKDNAGKLFDPEDYDRIVGSAVEKFSKDKPAQKVLDIVGNGTREYDLPNGWIDEYSSITSIEYPIGDVPASLLDRDEYEIYQTPAAKKLRLLKNTVPATESFRVSFTVLRTATNIPDGDLNAFTWLAASLCCEELANAYAQTGDSTIAADSVDYKDKSYRFAQRAKSLMKLYKDHFGIKEDGSTPPASAVTDLDIGYPGGGDRLTHPRRQRERR